MGKIQRVGKDGTTTIRDMTPEEEAAQAAYRLENNETTERNRKIQALKATALTNVNVLMPEIDTFEEVEMLRKYARAFALSATGNSVKLVIQYARQQVQWLKTAPIADVIAYDPTTDPNWPA